MKAEDYIKDGDGNRIHINRKGVELTNRLVIKMGGLYPVAKLTGLHPNTISKLKNYGTCHPDTWDIVFEAISNQQTA